MLKMDDLINVVANNKVIEILLAPLTDRLSQLLTEQNLTQTSKPELSLTATSAMKMESSLIVLDEDC